MNAAELKNRIVSGGLDEKLTVLYGKDQLEAQKVRYTEAVDAFVELYGDRENLTLFSAPGRTEIAGNHTDHNHGRVVSANESGSVKIKSKGYPMDTVELSDLDANASEENKAISLIRGTLSRFVQKGHAVGSFDAYTTSNVLKGSGLSSSAAFEVLVGTILSHLYNEGSVDAVEIAKYAQYAENVYFGKPSGLMDQMASSVGNIITIDFADPAHPKIQPVAFDFASCGYSLCIIDSGASHSDLTDCYAAITNELKAVCRVFGKEALRDVPEDEFYARLGEVRQAAGDRAVLRAIHVYEDNKRVRLQLRALENDNFPAFLEYVKESGDSSWMYLQNVIPEGRTARQEVAFALALAKHLLGGHGACRVHGGGFAGTIQAFVPNEQLEKFRGGIEAVLGEGSCHVLSIRPEGGILAEVCSHD